MDQRVQSWVVTEQANRDRRAAQWRKARSDIAARDPTVGHASLTYWNRHRWLPGDPSTLLDMLHGFDRGRLVLLNGEVAPHRVVISVSEAIAAFGSAKPASGGWFGHRTSKPASRECLFNPNHQSNHEAPRTKERTMANNNSSDWTDDVVQGLRRLWAEGHSTAEIGRQIGVSKNAVVGKARRLDLPGRPSPIAKKNMPLKRPAKHTTVTRLADIVPVDVTTPTPTRTPVPVRTTAPGTSPIPPKPAAGCIQPQPDETSRSVGRRPGGTCCWPIGEPGTTTFRFCGVSVAPRTAYCPDHACRAYVRRAEAS